MKYLPNDIVLEIDNVEIHQQAEDHVDQNQPVNDVQGFAARGCGSISADLDFPPRPDRPTDMGLRTRKLVGTLAIFAWVVVFSLTVMAVLGSFERPHVIVEITMYAVLSRFGSFMLFAPFS